MAGQVEGVILTLLWGVTSQLAHFPPPENDANEGKGIFFPQPGQKNLWGGESE